MKGYRYLFKNIGLLTISQFGTKLLAFFLVPLYTSFLTSVEYGTYDLFTTTINLLIPLLTLNICESVLLFTLDKTNKHADVMAIGLKYALIGFLFSIVFLAFNVLTNIFPPINKYWIYFPILFFLTVLNSLTSNFCRGLDCVKETAISGVICSVAMISLNLFFLIGLGMGLHGYYIANICALSFQIGYLFFSCKLWRFVSLQINKTLEKNMKSFSIPLIANNIGWWINNSSDRYVVTWMCGVAANGIYSVGYKIPSILNMLQTIFNQAWTLSAVKDFDDQDSNGFFSNIYSIYNCGMVMCCSFIVLTSRLFAHVLYANEFFEAWRYVPFLTISIVFGALSGFLGGVFSAVKDSTVYGKSTMIGAVLNLLLNFILVYFIGPLGAAIATLISYCVVWAIRLQHTKKYIAIKINLKRDLLSYIFLLFQGIILFLLEDGASLYLCELIVFGLIVILNKKEIFKIILSIHSVFATKR